MGAPAGGDEGRHPPEAGTTRWEESWDFAFHTEGGDLGGYLRIGLHPALEVAWCWAALVGRRRPLLTVVDLDVALPRGPGLDLRAEGLWAMAEQETPMEHWTVGLEAFGVALDDPTEVWRSGRGDRRALGFDLEWETTGGPELLALAGAGYHLPCAVHGEVLVDDDIITVAGWGARSHAWGERDWWGRSWCTTSGRFDDGTSWYGERLEVRANPGPGVLPRPVTVELGAGLSVAVQPLPHAPVRLDAPGRGCAQLARALCLGTATDGRSGVGWTEWNRPLAPGAPG